MSTPVRFVGGPWDGREKVVEDAKPVLVLHGLGPWQPPPHSVDPNEPVRLVEHWYRRVGSGAYYYDGTRLRAEDLP